MSLIRLAFLVLIITIFIQKDELKLQREELKGQKEQLEKQNKLYETQFFETTFFNMINLHHKIIDSLSKENLSGRQVLNKEITTLINKHYNNKTIEFKESSPIIYNLFNIFRFLDQKGSSIEISSYIEIAKSQLTKLEFILLKIVSIYQISTKSGKLGNKYALFVEEIPPKTTFPPGVITPPQNDNYYF
jgi:uncharacterized protein YacL (UPF0231 family)